jgi:hypothetical protein
MSFTPKTSFFRLFAIGLVAVPPFALAHPTVIPAVAVENWGLSDYLGFFAIAVVVFAVLIRRGLLRPKKFQS